MKRKDEEEGFGERLEVYHSGKKVGEGYFFITTDLQSFHFHFSYFLEEYLIDESMVFAHDYITRNGFISHQLNTSPRKFWQDILNVQEPFPNNFAAKFR